MKIIASHNEGDPNHWGRWFQKCPKVYLNGLLVDDPICEVDDTAGYVVVIECDGDRMRVAPDGESIATRKITGRVDIVGERLPQSGEAT